MDYISLQKNKSGWHQIFPHLCCGWRSKSFASSTPQGKEVYPYIWLLSHQRISTSKTTAQVRRKNSMYYWICLISHRLDTSQMSHCLSFHILSFTQTFIARLSCVTYLAKINQAGLWIPGIIISLWPWICLHLTLKQSCKCAATCLIQIIIAKHSEQYYIFVIFYSETILQNKYTWG